MRLLQIIAMSLIFTSCVHYQTRPVHGLVVQRNTQWGVFRNDYVIPEFTKTGTNDYAKTRQDAEKLFTMRKDKIEKFIPLKYAPNAANPIYYAIFGVGSILAIPFDIVTLPIYAVVHQYYKHKDPIYDANVKFEWFPLTRFGFYELFYGPSNWFPLFGDSIPIVRQEWEENKKDQERLNDYLKETEKRFRTLAAARKCERAGQYFKKH